MTRRHIFVDKAAVRQAMNLGIVPNKYRPAERKIAEMAVNSAALTHSKVNRRYGDVGLLLVDNTVKRVIALSATASARMGAPYPRKGKSSCPTCKGSGTVPVPQTEEGDPSTIPCPDC